jgi:hypothetical protein
MMMKKMVASMRVYSLTWDSNHGEGMIYVRSGGRACGSC